MRKVLVAAVWLVSVNVSAAPWHDRTAETIGATGEWSNKVELADLDGDGTDELYVASDNDGELRRYVWVNGRPRRTVIHSRNEARSMITWNLATAPIGVLR